MSELIKVEKVTEFARELPMTVRNEVTNPVVWAREQECVLTMMGAYTAAVEADQRAPAEGAEC